MTCRRKRAECVTPPPPAYPGRRGVILVSLMLRLALFSSFCFQYFSLSVWHCIKDCVVMLMPAMLCLAAVHVFADMLIKPRTCL